MNQIIGFVGSGNMASSLIGGLLSCDIEGINGEQILVFDPSTDKVDALVEKFDVRRANDNESLVLESDVVVIAVKPQAMQSVLQPLGGAFRESSALIVSIVAGITSASIEAWLQAPCAIARVMPNTPALVGSGASGMYANKRVTDSQRATTETLMNAVGLSVWVNSEDDIDTVTALSGSGPAYFMLFIQSLVDAAMQAGLEETAAKTLAVQTAMGAAELVCASDQSIQTLIDNVTSPGGTTEQALLSFNQSNLKQAVRDAFDAAKHRSQELARELA